MQVREGVGGNGSRLFEQLSTGSVWQLSTGDGQELEQREGSEVAFFVNQIVGKQPNGEQFIMGLNIDTGAVGTGTAQTTADQIRDTFAANWNGIRGMFNEGTVIQKVVTYQRPKTATGAATEMAEAIFTPALAGQLTGQVLTPETALCVSLLCDEPGRSHRGRFFLPAFSTQVIDTRGELGTTSRDSVAAWAAALLGGINTTAGPGYQVVVWSRKNASTSVVTRVRVGNQFDVQRRRQNGVGEAYKEVAVSTV